MADLKPQEYTHYSIPSMQAVRNLDLKQKQMFCAEIGMTCQQFMRSCQGGADKDLTGYEGLMSNNGYQRAVTLKEREKNVRLLEQLNETERLALLAQKDVTISSQATQITTLISERNAALATVATRDATISSLNQTIVTLTAERDQAINERDQAIAERDAKDATIVSLNQTIATRDATIAANESIISSQAAQISTLTSERDAALATVATRDATISSLNQTIADRDATIVTLTAERDQAIADKQQAETERDQAIAERDALQQQVDEQSQTINTLEGILTSNGLGFLIP